MRQTMHFPGSINGSPAAAARPAACSAPCHACLPESTEAAILDSRVQLSQSLLGLQELRHPFSREQSIAAGHDHDGRPNCAFPVASPDMVSLNTSMQGTGAAWR